MSFRSYLKHRHFKHNTAGVSYTPTQVAKVYSFPKGVDGTGKKIGFIELGGDFQQADLDFYFKSLGLTVKPVVAHLVDGAKRVSDPGGADGEVMLDLEIGGAIAPGAELHCYFALNTDAGFIAAIKQATADKMDAISISWGSGENNWAKASVTAMSAAFAAARAAGITVTAAAGDNGSGDGEAGQHVDYPASDPNVLGCGGTSLLITPSLVETVWNDGTKGGATGGGVSSLFALPDYQKTANVPGSTHRGVPDVGGLADPETGWSVYVGGAWAVYGGTSAVAPMWAALSVLLSQTIGKNVGFLNELIYTLPAGSFRDIVTGNNGTYTARAGYDCNTGNGVPVGDKLAANLGAPLPTPAPPPVVTQPPPVVTPPAPVHSTRALTISGDNLVILADGKTI